MRLLLYSRLEDKSPLSDSADSADQARPEPNLGYFRAAYRPVAPIRGSGRSVATVGIPAPG